MTDLTLDEAVQAAEKAQADLIAAGKKALREVLTSSFENPEIQTIAWAQKYSEYDDEGLYPGITGPVINVVDGDDPMEGVWGWTYGGGDANGFPEEYGNVKNMLDAVGEETICNIVGDDNNIVVAIRDERRDVGYSLFTEYAGY